MMSIVANDLLSYATGEWGVQMFTGGRPAPTHDEIARVAFCYYELRGKREGHDVEDWLRAEQELRRHYS